MLLKPNRKGFVNKYVPVDYNPRLLNTGISQPEQEKFQKKVRFSRLHKMGTLFLST